jgi:rare lipoprotein A
VRLIRAQTALAVGFCLAFPAARALDPKPPRPRLEWGHATWYGPGFHGQLTASGEVFNMHGLTAAHRDLPLGSRVRVTNLQNGRHVVVRINDRGPWDDDRIIDLSYGASRRLGMVEDGVAPVRIERLPAGTT